MSSLSPTLLALFTPKSREESFIDTMLEKKARNETIGRSVRVNRDGTFELIPPRHRKKSQATWESMKEKEGVVVRDFAFRGVRVSPL